MPWIESDLQPGDIAAVRVNSDAGRLIDFVETLSGDGFTEWAHCVVYIGNAMVLQAEPGGAKIVKRTPLIKPGDIWSTGFIDITPEARTTVKNLAYSGYVGIPYSALDYFAIAGHRLHMPDLPIWPQQGHLVSLQRYIADTGHMICSQLADNFVQKLGVHLFTDNRWPGYVTPADIGNRLRTLGATALT
jgi:hypothetical protein